MSAASWVWPDDICGYKKPHKGDHFFNVHLKQERKMLKIKDKPFSFAIWEIECELSGKIRTVL